MLVGIQPILAILEAPLQYQALPEGLQRVSREGELTTMPKVPLAPWGSARDGELTTMPEEWPAPWGSGLIST